MTGADPEAVADAIEEDGIDAVRNEAIVDAIESRGPDRFREEDLVGVLRGADDDAGAA